MNRKTLIVLPLGHHLDPGSAQVPIGVNQPFLAGFPEESWTMESPIVTERGNLTVWQNRSYLIAWEFRPTTNPEISGNTFSLYSNLLEVAHGWNVMRFWNWVPEINFWPIGGEENYRQFCTGRARAFSCYWGPGYESRLPAASALGVNGDQMGFLVFATRFPVRHVENPLQTPAYAYPPQYGRDAPGFSRGTTVLTPDGPFHFISGTSSVRESDTLHPGDLPRQIPVTLENLETVAQKLGVHASRRSKSFEIFTRIFLRKPAYLEEVQQGLINGLSWASGSMVFLQADICRRDLDLEIEITARPKALVLRD